MKWEEEIIEFPDGSSRNTFNIAISGSVQDVCQKEPCSYNLARQDTRSTEDHAFNSRGD